eukprot:TRINITY_DN3033_c0_g1_i1.p1 TRINITY_DN3033_c0_g1~~TRINITY_DN3033_c0_g1_i1.p1  ORF type:complete len:626 (+),score=178.37 TRINITY_DN3033_c0_g1_i1:49-1878(+)
MCIRDRLYNAEEAVGLAKSLGWTIVKGPFWQEEDTIALEQQAQAAGLDAPPSSNLVSEEEIRKYFDETPRDCVEGDYVYTPFFKGEYHKGGVILDITSSEDEAEDLAHEWRNVTLRKSLAKSSMVKVRTLHSKTFFTRGRLLSTAAFIRQKGVQAVFFNTELTPTQTRNLQRIFSLVANLPPEELKGLLNPETGRTRLAKLLSELEESDSAKAQGRSVRVFDRFSVILQIFAQRAKTRLAKYQIELAFINYLKSRLARAGGTTFSSSVNLFSGDLMSAKEVNLEIISAKQRGASGRGFLAGEGESQLEIERRTLAEREAKIRRELLAEERLAERSRKHSSSRGVPQIALIGYTNAGKSALMNALLEQEVAASADLLFQTLSILGRKFRLENGLQAVLLDTVGFISGLPHELVASFKATLDEVRHADLVVHIRDISHPNTEDQKRAVLRVLSELGFDASFSPSRLVEVWNKIDLLEAPLDYEAIKKSDITIVPVSALHGMNLDKLREVVAEKATNATGRKLRKLEYSSTQHQERLSWLMKDAGVVNPTSFSYDHAQTDEFPYGKITIEVPLDEATLRRFEAHFGSRDEPKRPRSRDEPPPDWEPTRRSKK